MKRLVAAAAVLLLAGCPSKPATPDAGPPPRPSNPLPRPGPAPKVPPLERVMPPEDAGTGKELDFLVAPFTPLGPALPEDAVFVGLDGEKALLDAAPFDPTSLKPGAKVVLIPRGDTYLAQAAKWLAALDDAKAEVSLKHPDAAIAFPLRLRDEPAFQAWLDEIVAGKLRVIHRTDGFELMTNVGKLSGEDVNGPTVPLRGGSMDLATLQKGLLRMRQYFRAAPDWCEVPSFGMELNDVARAMAANYTAADAPLFGETCLVYPRPQARDAGR